MALELVARIGSLVEAQIAAGALRSGGIDAEVFDANFGQVESPVIESLGGFRLMAPAHQAETARELLKALRAAPGLPAGEDQSPWDDRRPPSVGARARTIRRIWAAIFVVSAALWIAQSLLSRS